MFSQLLLNCEVIERAHAINAVKAVGMQNRYSNHCSELSNTLTRNDQWSSQPNVESALNLHEAIATEFIAMNTFLSKNWKLQQPEGKPTGQQIVPYKRSTWKE